MRQDGDPRHAVVDAKDHAGKIGNGDAMLAPQGHPVGNSALSFRTVLAALNADFAFDEDEFLDPVTRDVIIDPIVASDGNTYDRLSAYRLVVRGSNMPCAAGTLSLGPDNLYFRRRLRRAYPDTEQAMCKQREECVEMGRAALGDERFGVALYWFELVRTWAPSSLQTEIETCQAAGVAPALPEGPDDVIETSDEETDDDDRFEELAEARSSLREDPEDGLVVCDWAMAGSTADGLRETALMLRGDASTELRRWEAAVQDYTLVLDLNPDNVNALIQRAGAHCVLDKHQAAIEDCDAALQHAMGDSLILALTIRGRVKGRSQDFMGALEDFNTAVAMDPNSALALAYRGMFRLQGGPVLAAIADLEAALRLDPDHAMAAEALEEAMEINTRSRGRRPLRNNWL